MKEKVLLKFKTVFISAPNRQGKETGEEEYWSEIKKKNTLRGVNIPLRGRGLKCFSPLRGTNSKTIHYLLFYFFSAQNPERYRKSSHCGLLRLNP